MARAGGRAIRGLNRTLEPFGLRSRHHAVLMAAARHGSLHGIDPSVVVALVDDLQQAGYVRRDPHPADRRTRLVVLTGAGQNAFTRASVLATQVDDEILAPLSAAERATLRTLLARIALAD